MTMERPTQSSQHHLLFSTTWPFNQLQKQKMFFPPPSLFLFFRFQAAKKSSHKEEMADVFGWIVPALPTCGDALLPPSSYCFFCSASFGTCGLVCSCVESSFLPLSVLSLEEEQQHSGEDKSVGSGGVMEEEEEGETGMEEEDSAGSGGGSGEKEGSGSSSLRESGPVIGKSSEVRRKEPATYLPTPPFRLPGNGGQYTKLQRLALIQRYLEKKNRPPPSEGVKSRYLVRSKFACSRPRVGGRFVPIPHKKNKRKSEVTKSRTVGRTRRSRRPLRKEPSRPG